MNATAHETPSVDAGTVENIWTCIAEEVDGEPVAESVGTRELERSAYFSMKDAAERWLERQASEGFEVRGPTPLATRYYGPTDSPSNAWAVRATRAVAA